MSTTKIAVQENGKTIGTISPYSYQVKGKTESKLTQVFFDGHERKSRLTKGQGKGEKTRYYIYFMVGDFQHWIELTAAAHEELTKNPAAVLELVPAAAPVKTEVAEEPVVEAPKKAKRVKREAVAA